MAQAKIAIRASRRSGLSSAPMFNAPKASAATFVKGAPVKLTTGALAAVSLSGALKIPSSSSTMAIKAVKASSRNNIIGIAEGQDVASTTTALVVRRIQEGQAFEGNLVHRTQSSAKLAATDLGTSMILVKHSSDTHWGFGKSTWFKSSSIASVVRGKLVGLIDTASTVNGRVLVEVTKGGALTTIN